MWRSLFSVAWCIFLLVLLSFFPFFSLHLPQLLTHFSLLWGVGRGQTRLSRLCCCFVLGAVCSDSQGAEPGWPQCSCTLHTPGSQPKSPPQFLFTDSFLMLICCSIFSCKKCILIFTFEYMMRFMRFYITRFYIMRFYIMRFFLLLYIWIDDEILLVKNKQLLCFVRYRLLHYLFAAFLTIPDFSILLPFSLLLAICLQKQNRQAW